MLTVTSSSSLDGQQNIDAAVSLLATVPTATATAAATATVPTALAAPTPHSAPPSSTEGSAQPPLRQAGKLLTARLSAGQNVDILKVDVEGREPDVFDTATQLMDSGRVQNIVMEYSPGYYYQTTDRT